MTNEFSPRTIEAVAEIDDMIGQSVCSSLLPQLVEPASFAGACFDFMGGLKGAFNPLEFVTFIKNRGLLGCAKKITQAILQMNPGALSRLLA